jgi:hypothetical protein
MIRLASPAANARRELKTGRPVRFDLTEQTRQAIDDYIRVASKKSGEDLFVGRRGQGQCMTTRQAGLRRQYDRLPHGGSRSPRVIEHDQNRSTHDHAPTSMFVWTGDCAHVRTRNDSLCRGPYRRQPGGGSGHHHAEYDLRCSSAFAATFTVKDRT